MRTEIYFSFCSPVKKIIRTWSKRMNGNQDKLYYCMGTFYLEAVVAVLGQRAKPVVRLRRVTLRVVPVGAGRLGRLKLGDAGAVGRVERLADLAAGALRVQVGRPAEVHQGQVGVAQLFMNLTYRKKTIV